MKITVITIIFLTLLVACTPTPDFIVLVDETPFVKFPYMVDEEVIKYLSVGDFLNAVEGEGCITLDFSDPIIYTYCYVEDVATSEVGWAVKSAEHYTIWGKYIETIEHFERQ